uniref:Uncharacterized protein n=1 Tax=Sphaerodactylus townsendi TaxID=933632 RepID=A0ACB8EQU2_9SAUR
MKRKTSVAGSRRNSALATYPATLPPAVKKTRSSATFQEVSEEDEPSPRPHSRESCLQITGVKTWIAIVYSHEPMEIVLAPIYSSSTSKQC